MEEEWQLRAQIQVVFTEPGDWQRLRSARPAPACAVTTPASHPAPARSPSRQQPPSEEALSHPVLHTPRSPERLAALRVHQPRPAPSGRAGPGRRALGDTTLPSQWGGSSPGRLRSSAETALPALRPLLPTADRSIPKEPEAGRRRNGEGGGWERGRRGRERAPPPASPMGRGHGRGRGRAAAC